MTLPEEEKEKTFKESLAQEEERLKKEIENWLTLCEKGGFLAKFKKLRKEIKRLNIERFLGQNSDGSSKTLEEELKWEVVLEKEVYDLSNDQQLKNFKSKLEEVKAGEKTEEKNRKLQILCGKICDVSIKEESPLSPEPTKRRFEAIEKLLAFNVKGGITINEDNVKALAGEYQLEFLNDASQNKVLIKYLIGRKVLTKLLEWEPTEVPHYPNEDSEERRINKLTQNLIKQFEQLPDNSGKLNYGPILAAQLRAKVYGWLAPNTYPENHPAVTKKAEEIEKMCKEYASLEEKKDFEKKIRNLTRRIWREFYFYLKALPTASTWEFLDRKTVGDFLNDEGGTIKGIELEEGEFANDNPIFCWFPLVKRPTDKNNHTPLIIWKSPFVVIDLKEVKKIDVSMKTKKEQTETNAEPEEVVKETENGNSGRTDNELTELKEKEREENSPQDEYKNLWELIKNATQLEELNREELSDENIDKLMKPDNQKNSEWKNQKQNLKYARDLKKELLTRGFTDEELTNELQQQKRENLQLGPENDWYCLFKSQVSNKIQTKNEIQRIIIELAEIKAWEKFFAEKVITDPDHQKKWKQTGLSPLSDRPGILPQTERAWQKGWHDLTDPNISLENSHSSEIEYFYEEIIEGETEKSSLRIKLLQVSYSDVEIFLELINKINNVNNPKDIKTAREKLNEIENPQVKIRINTVIKNKVGEIWKRFFNLHPEIDTPLKKVAWKKSGLNPIEISLGEADSEADIAWDNDWTDLTLTDDGKNISIALSDGVGKIEIIEDEKVKYTSYEYSHTFDSLHELLTDYWKDDIDKHFFWEKFKEHYEGWWNIRRIVGNNLAENEQNRDKAEKWRQKGYSPSDASRYQENGWEPEEADEEQKGWANYKNGKYDMTERKRDIENVSGIENNEVQSEADTTQQTVELRGQVGEERTAQPASEPEGGRREVEEGDVALHTADLEETNEATTATELPNEDSDEVVIAEISEESSETITPYEFHDTGDKRNETPNSQGTTTNNQEEAPTIPILKEQQERNLNYLKSQIDTLKKDEIKKVNIRNSLINLLKENDQNWGNYWQIWHEHEYISIEKWIPIHIQEENWKKEAQDFLKEAKNEVLQELKKIWLKGEIESNSEWLIDKAANNVSKRDQYIEGVENESHWTTRQWNNGNFTISCFIDTEIKNENDRNELKTFFDKTRTETVAEVTRKLLGTTMKEETDKHPTRNKPETTEQPEIPVTPVTEKQKDPDYPEQSWGKIATRGAIVVVVAGVIGAGVWKWLSSRRKPKISKYN